MVKWLWKDKAPRCVAIGVAGVICGTAQAMYGVGSLDATGFDYIGTIGGGSGDVIGSHWVATAKHVGGMSFTLNGTTYTADQRYDNPGADVSLLHFTNTFADYYAPYYGDIIGQTLTYVGFGYTASLRTDGDLAYTGYSLTGGSAGVRRKMTNTAGRIAVADDGWGLTTCIEGDLDSSYTQSPAANQIDFLGDGGATANEGGLLFGDSGSAALIQIAGKWRIVGVNIAIDDTNGPNPGGNDNYLDFGDTFYSTSVQAYQSWMESTMNPVPEPASIIGLTVGGLALLSRRRRSR